jgi:metallo-beta-lactamase family protein
VFKWGKIQRIDKFNEVEEKLIDNKPKIILASSGMCTGGYTTYLCQQMVGRPNVCMLFSGYVGEGTAGRAILDTLTKENKYVTIQGVKYRVRCQLPERLELSGHADSTQIMKLLTQSFNQKKLKRIIIVHGGEEERKYIVEQLSQKIDMGNKEISTIKENETIRIN